MQSTPTIQKFLIDYSVILTSPISSIGSLDVEYVKLHTNHPSFFNPSGQSYFISIHDNRTDIIGDVIHSCLCITSENLAKTPFSTGFFSRTNSSRRSIILSRSSLSGEFTSLICFLNSLISLPISSMSAL